MLEHEKGGGEGDQKVRFIKPTSTIPVGSGIGVDWEMGVEEGKSLGGVLGGLALAWEDAVVAKRARVKRANNEADGRKMLGHYEKIRDIHQDKIKYKASCWDIASFFFLSIANLFYSFSPLVI